MNKRKFGRTDLLLSELCLNPDNFGPGFDATAAFAVLDTYYAAGGRFIQTSSDAGSEELVGRWIEARGIARASLTIAVRISLPRPVRGGTTAYVNLIRESCARSLGRLHSKHVDLMICEWDGHFAPVDDLLAAITMLIRAGWVRHAVAGGFPSWRVVDSLHRARLHNHARFEGLHADYALTSRARMESETFSMCREHRLGFLADSPLAGGWLARRPISLREVINADRSWHDIHSSGQTDPVLKALAGIADRRAADPAGIALAWVLQNHHVTAAVISPSSAGELAGLIHAPEIVLSAEEMATLATATAPRIPHLESSHT